MVISLVKFIDTAALIAKLRANKKPLIGRTING